jgi:hypothetical protein
MGNDHAGDCVVAAMGHVIEMWMSLASGQQQIITDAGIIQAYSDITGYDPATGSSDSGMQIPDGLGYWFSHGVSGHRLTRYVRIFPQLTRDIKLSIACFGACIVAMNVNAQILDAFRNGSDWIDSYGSADDGHCVPLIAYDSTYLECVTWGRVQRMNWAFFGNYVDEAYVPLGPEWFRADGVSPSGYTAGGLSTLLTNIALTEWVP